MYRRIAKPAAWPFQRSQAPKEWRDVLGSLCVASMFWRGAGRPCDIVHPYNQATFTGTPSWTPKGIVCTADTDWINWGQVLAAERPYYAITLVSHFMITESTLDGDNGPHFPGYYEDWYGGVAYGIRCQLFSGNRDIWGRLAFQTDGLIFTARGGYTVTQDTPVTAIMRWRYGDYITLDVFEEGIPVFNAASALQHSENIRYTDGYLHWNGEITAAAAASEGYMFAVFDKWWPDNVVYALGADPYAPFRQVVESPVGMPVAPPVYVPPGGYVIEFEAGG